MVGDEWDEDEQQGPNAGGFACDEVIRDGEDIREILVDLISV